MLFAPHSTNGSFFLKRMEKSDDFAFYYISVFFFCVGHKMQFNTKNVLILVMKVEQNEAVLEAINNSISASDVAPTNENIYENF